MARESGTPIIKWLELAVSTRWQDEGTVATVHPMAMAADAPCFGITLGKRWLCSCEGALTLFESELAASRFLNLLNVNGQSLGGDDDSETPEQVACQCFRLDTDSLTACRKCSAGDHRRAPALVASNDAHWDGRW